MIFQYLGVIIDRFFYMSFLKKYRSLEGRELVTELDARRHFAFFNEKYKYFAQGDELSFSQFFQISRVILADQVDTQPLYYDRKTAHNICEKAYKLLIFFGDKDIESTLGRFDTFQERNEALIKDYPSRSYGLFAPWKEVPVCFDYAHPPFDLEAWKKQLIDFGPEVVGEATYLARIETHLGRVPDTKEEFSKELPLIMYNRAGENSKMAQLALKYKLDEEEFNFALSNHGKVCLVDHPELPDIVIDLSSKVPEYFDIKDGEDGSTLELKPRGEDSVYSPYPLPSDTYDRKYIVKLPSSDPRYSLMCSQFFKAIPGYVEPKTHSIYVLVESCSDKFFDPHNIDWDNLDRDNHQILLFAFLSQGPSGEIYFKSSETSPMIPNDFIYRIFGNELAKILPNMEVLI